MNGIIYKITFPNNKVYIGQTTREMLVRFRQHIKDAFTKTKYNNKICRAIRKHTTKANAEKILKVEILETNIPINDLNELEEYYIQKYNSYKNGYNSTLGGVGIRGLKHTKASKKKISKRSKQQKGMLHPSRKTTQDEVYEMRQMFLSGISGKEIWKRFDYLAYTTVMGIVKNTCWYEKKYEKQYKAFIKENKMNFDRAQEIRVKYINEDISIPELAKQYNISTSCAGNILHNKVFKDVNLDKQAIANKMYDNTRKTAKLNMGVAREIRKLHKQYSRIELAEKYGVGPATISSIINNKKWKE